VAGLGQVVRDVGPLAFFPGGFETLDKHVHFPPQFFVAGHEPLSLTAGPILGSARYPRNSFPTLTFLKVLICTGAATRVWRRRVREVGHRCQFVAPSVSAPHCARLPAWLGGQPARSPCPGALACSRVAPRRRLSA